MRRNWQWVQRSEFTLQRAACNRNTLKRELGTPVSQQLLRQTMKKQLRTIFAATLWLLLLAAPSLATSPRRTITAIDVSRQDVDVIALIRCNSNGTFRQFTMTEPHRLVIDLRNTQQSLQPSLAPNEHLVFAGSGDLLRVRVGQIGESVRVVFDLASPLRYQITPQAHGLLVRFIGKPMAPRSNEVTPPSATETMRATVAVKAPVVTNPSTTIAPGAMTADTALGVGHQTQNSTQVVSAKEGRKSYGEGLKYEAQQQWELAVQQFLAAVQAEPTNPEYKLHLLRAQQNASLLLTQQGDTLASAENFAAAASAYRLAHIYDPTNEAARRKAERMSERQTPGEPPLPFNPNTGNVLAASVGIATATPRSSSDTLQVINFREVRLRQVIETFAERLGLNVLFDETFKDDPKFRLRLQDVTLARALDLVLLQSHHQFELVDRRTILIYSDNPTNRLKYEQLLVKTFYLGSANLDEVRGLLQQMIGAQRQIAVIKQLNALVVRDTPANLKLVQELIDSVDKNRAEVVVDVNIYEVSRSTSLEIGNQLALSPTSVTSIGADGKAVTTGNSASLGNLGGVGRAALGSIAGTAVSPVLGGVGTLIGLPPSSLSLLQSKGNSKLLASTQIHALDGEQNQTKVGRSVPVRLGSTIVPGYGTTTPNANPATAALNGIFGGGFGGGFDSIQYRDVGLVIDVTPTVSNEGYVQLKLKLESTSVEASGADVTLTPSFTQRSLSTLARVLDGKTAVVAGIKQESKGESRAGLPVLGMLPLLGRFMTTPRQSSNLSDIVITVTPHILRAPDLRKEDHLAKQGGKSNSGVTMTVEEVVARLATTEPRRTERTLIAEQPQKTETATTPATIQNTAAQTVSANYPTPANNSTAATTSSPATTPDIIEVVPASPVSDVVMNLLPSIVTPQNGEPFLIAVSINGSAKITEAQVALRYDTTQVQFVRARSGSVFGNTPNLSHQDADGNLILRVRALTPVSANGQFVLLEFKPLQNVPSVLRIDPVNSEVRNENGNVTPVSTNNAQVELGRR
jgi:general secretion pathway protein D